MDPNVLLATIRELQSKVSYIRRNHGIPPLEITVALHEAVEDMDEWLSKGGFLPDAWTAEQQKIDTEVMCGTAALDELLDGEYNGGLR